MRGELILTTSPVTVDGTDCDESLFGAVNEAAVDSGIDRTRFAGRAERTTGAGTGGAVWARLVCVVVVAEEEEEVEEASTEGAEVVFARLGSACRADLSDCRAVRLAEAAAVVRLAKGVASARVDLKAVTAKEFLVVGIDEGATSREVVPSEVFVVDVVVPGGLIPDRANKVFGLGMVEVGGPISVLAVAGLVDVEEGGKDEDSFDEDSFDDGNDDIAEAGRAGCNVSSIVDKRESLIVRVLDAAEEEEGGGGTAAAIRAVGCAQLVDKSKVAWFRPAQIVRASVSSVGLYWES